LNSVAGQQKRAAVGVAGGVPPVRLGHISGSGWKWGARWGIERGNTAAWRAISQGIRRVKVIASSLRKGNVVDMGGRLCVVLSASNFHPGKGTPTTSVEMRRISDGVKMSERYKTTDQVEKATVDERDYDFLYEDSEGFHFMEPTTYDQIVVTDDVMGGNKVYVQEGMRCSVKTFEGVPIALEVQQRITFEITETEPVVKGQTASSSYKPALTANGLRIMVPPHIGVGTRVVINTDDDSYVERAKD